MTDYNQGGSFAPTIQYQVLNHYFRAWNLYEEAQMRLYDRDISAPYDAYNLLVLASIGAYVQVASTFKKSHEHRIGRFEDYLARSKMKFNGRREDILSAIDDEHQKEYQIKRLECLSYIDALDSYLRAVKQVLEEEDWLSVRNWTIIETEKLSVGAGASQAQPHGFDPQQPRGL